MALDINPSSITKESVHDFLSEVDTDALMDSIDDILDSFGDSERKRAQRVIDELNKEHEKQNKNKKEE